MVTISQQMAVTSLEEEILLSNLYQASSELGQLACPECQLHLGDVLFHREAVPRANTENWTVLSCARVTFPLWWSSFGADKCLRPGKAN